MVFLERKGRIKQVSGVYSVLRDMDEEGRNGDKCGKGPFILFPSHPLSYQHPYPCFPMRVP
eukprot:766794-Hanusia_phi.AAC.1